MTQRSRPWDGEAVGDASESPYTAAEFARIFEALSYTRHLTGVSSRGGILRGVGSRLEVTGTSSPVSVGSGEAFVHGTWYENTAAVTVTIPTPSAATRIDRIVLQKDHSAQTIRIVRIAGAEGSGVPALTQSTTTVWEISLAQVSVTTAGVVTVTSERVLLPHNGLIAEVTLTEDTDSITFSSVPSIYGNLELVLQARSTITAFNFSNVRMQLNSATGATSYAWAASDGTEDNSDASIFIGAIPGGVDDTSVFGTIQCLIPRYRTTDQWQTIASQFGMFAPTALDSRIGSTFGIWKSTSAITTIKVFPDTLNFKAGTYAMLRGIPG